MKNNIAFSIILFVLLVGSLGTNIYTQYQFNQSTVKYKKDLEYLEASIANQKLAKNKIRDLWENQAATNDKLVIAQDDFDRKTQTYLSQIKKTFRFNNTVIQILPSANENDILAAEKNLNEARSNLEKVNQENTQQKTLNKEQIDAIYINLNEDQTNRANPREGIR